MVAVSSAGMGLFSFLLSPFKVSGNEVGIEMDTGKAVPTALVVKLSSPLLLVIPVTSSVIWSES